MKYKARMYGAQLENFVAQAMREITPVTAQADISKDAPGRNQAVITLVHYLDSRHMAYVLKNRSAPTNGVSWSKI